MDKTRVLVVDDEQDTLHLLKLLLEVSGFDPITTLNSVEAIQLAELENPDVILLDIMMPKLDGFALCKMMRQHPELKNHPIIFVTAYAAIDLEDRRVEAGADFVLPKPIDMDKLTEAIENVRSEKLKAREMKLSTAPILSTSHNHKNDSPKLLAEPRENSEISTVKTVEAVESAVVPVAPTPSATDTQESSVAQDSPVNPLKETTEAKPTEAKSVDSLVSDDKPAASSDLPSKPE